MTTYTRQKSEEIIVKFEEFEGKIWKRGYGIAAMNHYTINGQRLTYCVVLNRAKQRAFKSERENSEKVFEDIYNQILIFKK